MNKFSSIADAVAEEALEQTIISLTWKQGRLGASIVHAEASYRISLLEEQPETTNLPTVESRNLYIAIYLIFVVLNELEPNIVLLPGRGEHHFNQTVETLITRINNELNDNKQIDWQCGLAREYQPNLFRTLFMVTDDLVNTNKLSIMAASALLAFLQRVRPAQKLPSEIEWFNMTDCLALDWDTLVSLQIISDERHPNMHVSKLGAGGLSLMSLANKCKSPAGRKLLWQWIVRPLKDRVKIQERLDIIEKIIKKVGIKGLLPEFQEIFRGIPRIEILFPKLCRKAYQAFIDLDKFLRASKEMNSSILRDIWQVLENNNEAVAALEELHSLLTSVIDLKQTRIQSKLALKSRVNADLDRLRHQYNDLPVLLNNVVRQIADQICNPKVKKINVVYFPQLGFLVTIAMEEAGEGNPIELESGFELQFVTEKVAYYKDSMTRQLDAELGDVYGEILDLEAEVIHQLIDRIFYHRMALVQIAHEMSIMDCLLTLADFAQRNKLTKPELVDSSIIEITQGRHILQERVCDHVVPNDIQLGSNEDDRVLVLTGPNGSGKSVFMKQVALIVVLAQVGSFVPAEHARLGIVDQIFTRIQTRESHASTTSAFQTDLLQIQRATSGATEQSLVLIDEFGKGTIPEQGIAIFAATIKYFATIIRPPLTIAITHFHEIYQRHLLLPSLPIKWFTMDFVEDGEITFLYRVINGKANSSLGVLCARKAGLPESILKRAEELMILYDAEIPSVAIRYAQIDPTIEHVANKLVQTLINGEENLYRLRELATLLTNHQ